MKCRHIVMRWILPSAGFEPDLMICSGGCLQLKSPECFKILYRCICLSINHQYHIVSYPPPPTPNTHTHTHPHPHFHNHLSLSLNYCINYRKCRVIFLKEIPTMKNNKHKLHIAEMKKDHYLGKSLNCTILTLLMLNKTITCLCKQYRSRKHLVEK